MSGDCGSSLADQLKVKSGSDVKQLLELGPEDLYDYETAEEYLLCFSRTGKSELVFKLLQLSNNKRINLNINCKGECKSNFGWSPLHLAAYFGHGEVVDQLLKHGANVDIQNEEGDTPLHKAAYTGREDIVIALITKQADVFIVNGDGLRAYEVAKSEGIRRALAAAENSETKRREDRFLSAARSGNVTILKQLLEDAVNPVNIDCVDSSGNTALHNAAYRGQNEAVVFLLKSGIDTTQKNNRDQLAANVASTISLKQLIQEVHLSVVTPQTIATLKNRTVSRFEGELFKKGRFFGWKLIWVVLERGVFMFFANRADAAAGIRRKGYKYMESAIVETVSTNDGQSQQQQQLMFLIIFGDRSRAMFCLPKHQTEIDLQKWLNAINDHIYFGTNFIKQGTRIDDSDDEDEAAKLLPLSTVQDIISTAGAHQKILERHINALQQLLDDPSFFSRGKNYPDEALSTTSEGNSICNNNSFRNYVPSPTENEVHNSSSVVTSTIKFHLNLILESSRNANSSLSQCLTVIAHQNEARQAAIYQEQEKVRVLEEALQVLAREHHDLERSITGQVSNQVALIGESSSLHVSRSRQDFPSRVHSVSCLSEATTNLDEFYDAFDDLDEEEEIVVGSHEMANITTSSFQLRDRSTSTPVGKLQPASTNTVDGLLSNNNRANSTTINSFHTAREELLGALVRDETINEDISNLDEDEDDDKTIAEEMDQLEISR